MKSIPALELRGVSYHAAGKLILRSVDWRIGTGERWAVLGPNGSGKTTLLKIACGYVWPNAGGEVLRKGKVLVNLPQLRKSIGWVTSTLNAQIPDRELVLRTVVSGRFAQVGYAEGFGAQAVPADYRRAQSFLNQMGCGALARQQFGTLSQGEQQKVLVARARMARPYLIVLDEPCAGMDPGARENFLRTLRVLGRQKKMPALIFVTHHVEEILPLFDNLLMLKDGRVLYRGRTRKVLNPAALRELFGVGVELVRRKGRHWPIVK